MPSLVAIACFLPGRAKDLSTVCRITHKPDVAFKFSTSTKSLYWNQNNRHIQTWMWQA